MLNDTNSYLLYLHYSRPAPVSISERMLSRNTESESLSLSVSVAGNLGKPLALISDKKTEMKVSPFYMSSSEHKTM